MKGLIVSFVKIFSGRKAIIALTTVAVSAALVVLPAVANASPASQSSPGESVGHQVQVGMNVAGFNAAVAKTHGYKIVTYANGDQQSVPIDSNSHLPASPILHRSSQATASASSNSGIVENSPQAVASPDGNSDYNSVVGNCGTSWIAVLQTGHYNVQVGSGYSVYTAVVSHYWEVTLSDANGTSQQSDPNGGATPAAYGRTWTNLYQYISTYDFIDSGIVQLDDGTVCYAGRPDVTIKTY
jgi:hypothetical protein